MSDADWNPTTATLLMAPFPRRALLEEVERLAISADAKALLARLIDVTVRVGDEVVALGRCVLTFAFEAVRVFPHIALGIIVGFVMWWLIASAAVVGALLGPLLGPLLAAFGIGAGAVMDVKDGGLRERVERWARTLDFPTSD